MDTTTRNICKTSLSPRLYSNRPVISTPATTATVQVRPESGRRVGPADRPQLRPGPLREAPADIAGYATSGLPARTMGRSIEEDPLFFEAPLAAGRWLAAG